MLVVCGTGNIPGMNNLILVGRNKKVNFKFGSDIDRSKKMGEMRKDIFNLSSLYVCVQGLLPVL